MLGVSIGHCSTNATNGSNFEEDGSRAKSKSYFEGLKQALGEHHGQRQQQLWRGVLENQYLPSESSSPIFESCFL